MAIARCGGAVTVSRVPQLVMVTAACDDAATGGSAGTDAQPGSTAAASTATLMKLVFMSAKIATTSAPGQPDQQVLTCVSVHPVGRGYGPGAVRRSSRSSPADA